VTPEALSTYLLQHGIDPDVTQEVMLVYLAGPQPPIKVSAKAWAWRRAGWIKANIARAERRRLAREQEAGYRVRQAPSPLDMAEMRQKLQRFRAAMPPSWQPGEGR